MSLKRWILLAFIAVVVFGVIVAAQADDDDEEEKMPGDVVEGQAIEEVADGIDAEDAAEELEDEMDKQDEGESSGLRAASYFPSYANMKVPAGERVEVVIPISNAPSNPNYEVALIAGHLALLDHSRFIQNFSAQVYQRTLEAGETATVKYSVTPDALIEPMEYAFVVAVYLRTDDNQTLMATAYNGTMTVEEPLGFDFKGLFSVVGFFAVLGGGAYFWFTQKQAARPAAPRKVAEAKAETGTKDTGYDMEFIDKSHLAYLESKQKRNRSASK